MKTYPLSIALLLFALLIPIYSSASEIEFKSMSIDEALKEALSQDKNIFVSYEADWCLPCQLMEESIFSDDKIITTLNDNFISIKANYDDLNYHEWFTSYNVSRLPTMTVFNEIGTEVDKVEGTTDINLFLSFLLKNSKHGRTLAASYAPISPSNKTINKESLRGDYVKLPSGATTTRASYKQQMNTEAPSEPVAAAKVQLVQEPQPLVKTNTKTPATQTINPNPKFTVIQFGAFSSYDNAVKLKDKVATMLDVAIIIHEDTKSIFKVMHADEISSDAFTLLVAKAKSNNLDFYVKT